MSRRKRWQNVKGTESRVTEPRERLMAVGVSLGAHVVAPFLSRASGDAPRDILILRLDRIGDVLMSLPALRALRDAAPKARIRLAVGEWSREIARDAAVDEVLIWSAPWVGRSDEGALSVREVFTKARALRQATPDLAIDLQGDVRAMWLMAATGARTRVGYANTGSAALLTEIVELNEDVNCVEQNYRAIEKALGVTVPRNPFRWIDGDGRVRGRQRMAASLFEAGIHRRGPLIGLHPGAGRSIKEWPIERFVELGRRLVHEKAATLVLTGSAGEAGKTAAIRKALPGATLDFAGKLTLAGSAEMMTACDAFVSCDTSAMHFACAMGVPSVAIFGPSDPVRYFSGGPSGFNSGRRHVALSPELWCSPCNLIRRPPEECDALPSPECLTLITTEAVFEATLSVLES
ncbi:MAG: glycosyltransferase family 9 protein [Vicinamibacteria bacterium]